MTAEDSENEAPTSLKQRALGWVEDIRTRPLTDEQATEVAKVYAALAAVEIYERSAAALEALRQPLEQFLDIYALSGGPMPPTSPTEPTAAPDKPPTEENSP